MSTTTAKAIRTALKTELGLNAKQVGVSSSHGSVRVTIKALGISKAKVDTLAMPFAKVDRCEATGEILCGGNTFVNVDYADGLFAEQEATLGPVFEALAVGGYNDVATGISVRRDDRYTFTVFASEGDDSRDVLRVWGATYTARTVAALLNERVAKANAVARELATESAA